MMNFLLYLIKNATNSGNNENGGLETYSYAVSDEVGERFTYYTTYQSDNPATAGRFIHPHQGFFIKVTSGGNINFNNDMRKAGKNLAPYRADLNYPLVNLFCYDENGKRDMTTVEISRPEFGGGHKMKKLHSSNALVYAYLENQGLQTLFTPVGITTVPVHLDVIENGLFTMRWDTYHGDFSYLHLIDNLAGVDVDCLAANEYKFEAKTTDYKSRFKLVFHCVGIDENEEETSPENFAFMFNDELVVNGEGKLQMFDIQGRCLMETQLNGAQNTVNLPKVAAGLYLLRLTGDKQLRVQKMVIK